MDKFNEPYTESIPNTLYIEKSIDYCEKENNSDLELNDFNLDEYNEESAINIFDHFTIDKDDILNHEDELNPEINSSELNNNIFREIEMPSLDCLKFEYFFKKSKKEFEENLISIKEFEINEGKNENFEKIEKVQNLENEKIVEKEEKEEKEKKEKKEEKEEKEDILIELNNKNEINKDNIEKEKDDSLKKEEQINQNNEINLNNNNNNKKEFKFIVNKAFNYMFYQTKIRKEINSIIAPLFQIKEKKSRNKFEKKKKQRKQKSDDVRKKIKSRFFKSLKNVINQNLKKANSELFFDFFPQCFIKEINRKRNKKILNMTFKELLSTNFFEEYNKPEITDTKNLQKKRHSDYLEDPGPLKSKKSSKPKELPDIVKYKNNLKVLELLKNNSELCKKSKFDIIGNMTFTDLFKEYLESKEFEDEIENLKNEKKFNKKKGIYEVESSNYIKDYIIKAYNLINYFSESD